MSDERLMELAARCEAATGPDRELDLTIAEAVGWQSDLVARARTWSPSNDTAALLADVEMDGLLRGLPAYTVSLDAGLRLVPEGWFTFLAGEDRHSHSWSWHLRGGFGINAKCRAPTPALALCAAALRARATSPTLSADIAGVQEVERG